MEDENEIIINEIRRLVPILGKERAARLEAAYLMQGEKGRKRIFEIIDMIKAATMSDVNLKNTILIEPPEKSVAENGDLTLGSVLYGKKQLYPLKLNKEDLLTHIGIFGSSGSGKTNVVYNLVSELNRLKIPILIFDFSKRNYRELLNVPELKDKIRIYTVGRNLSPFKFNPLKPPDGVEITQWAKQFSEVFDHSFSLLGGGRSVILKALKELYQNSFPTILNLLEWIEEYEKKTLSQRERNWLSTSKRSVESLCFMDTKDIFDCEEGILPSSFFEDDKINILELDNLSTDDKTFIIEIVLQWIKDWLVTNNVREKLKGVIILEEAHNILSREKGRMTGNETIMDIAFREFRELGIGIIYLDQHPSLISYPALGNTSTHIYMNLGLDTKYSSDIEDASKMLGLMREDRDYLRRIQVGDGFILLRKSTFPNPFLVRFPLSPIVKGSVDDDKIKKLVKIPDVKAQGYNVARTIRKLDSEDWKIIEVLGKGIATSASEISKSAKISGKTFKQTVRKLNFLGLVNCEEGKVYKQKADYYFLSSNGELIFRTKFQDGVNLDNWKNKNLEKPGKTIIVVDNLEKIGESLDEKDVVNFVCNGVNSKNIVIQRCARYKKEHPEKSFTVFIATEEDAEKNKWKKIEFA